MLFKTSIRSMVIFYVIKNKKTPIFIFFPTNLSYFNRKLSSFLKGKIGLNYAPFRNTPSILDTFQKFITSEICLHLDFYNSVHVHQSLCPRFYDTLTNFG